MLGHWQEMHYICTVCTTIRQITPHVGQETIKYQHSKKRSIMKKYVCDVCGWEYDPAVGDPEHGIAPGTAFEDLPDDFECPLCGVGKDEFSPEE